MDLLPDGFGLRSADALACFAGVPGTRILLKAWLPVLGWMLAIFLGSTDVLSSSHTSRVIGPFLRWFKPDLSDAAVERVQTVVRKCGHLSEYGILAVLCRRALHRQAGIPWRRWSGRTATLSVALCALYAASDEFHQSFVPSRESSVRDVLIDTAGAVLVLCAIRAALPARTRDSASAAPPLNTPSPHE